MDKTEDNPPPITPLLELCGMDQPPDEERGPLEPPMGERTVDDELNYLIEEIDTVMGSFLRLQTTMTTALERYQGCLLLRAQIHSLERVVLAAEHLGYDSQQMAYIKRKIPYLCLMEKIMWDSYEEIKPHLEYQFHPDTNMMVNHLKNLA